jgi:hypothetical protein
MAIRRGSGFCAWCALPASAPARRPGTARDVDRLQPRSQRRQHVIVDAVADIGDPFGPTARLREDTAKECRIGLGDMPARRRADEIRLEFERADEGFGLGAGVARYTDLVTGPPCPGERRQGIGIEVFSHEVIDHAGRPPRLPLLLEIDVGPEQAEHILIGTARLDDRAQRGEKGAAGHAQPCGPGGEPALFARQRLAYIEDQEPRYHAVRPANGSMPI